MMTGSIIDFDQQVLGAGNSPAAAGGIRLLSLRGVG